MEKAEIEEKMHVVGWKMEVILLEEIAKRVGGTGRPSTAWWQSPGISPSRSKNNSLIVLGLHYH
jgi:hypothetical protein